MVHMRKGITLIWVTVVFTTMVAFASLAVDFGRVQVAKTELLEAADAASRAGAGSLGSGVAAAKASAVDIAAHNRADGVPVTLQDGDMEFGLWAPPGDDVQSVDDWLTQDWTAANDIDLAEEGTY